MEVAKEVVTGILRKLGPEDSVGVVLFSDYGCLPLPLTEVNCLDMEKLIADFNVRFTTVFICYKSVLKLLCPYQNI